VSILKRQSNTYISTDKKSKKNQLTIRQGGKYLLQMATSIMASTSGKKNCKQVSKEEYLKI
jgi:hypothetical protein